MISDRSLGKHAYTIPSYKICCCALIWLIIIKLMIWSARKQYYLGFWAFLELKFVEYFNKNGVVLPSVLMSFPHATFMKIENDSVHEIRFKKNIDFMGGGLVSVYKNTHTGLKCLNANYVMPHSCRGGGDHFLKFRIRFFFLWRSSLTNYCKHFPKSICREFISPVGYFYNIY